MVTDPEAETELIKVPFSAFAVWYCGAEDLVFFQNENPNQTKPDNIQLAIKADGALYWNGEPVDKPVLAVRMAAAAKLNPQPEMHIRADGTTEYQKVAEVMSDAAKAGLVRIGFVTEPREAN